MGEEGRMNWIKLREQKPEKKGIYLVFVEGCKCDREKDNQDEFICMGKWDGAYFEMINNTNVFMGNVFITSWMELPHFPESDLR